MIGRWAYSRHPDIWVLSFRFVYGLRTVMPVAIGLSGYPPGRYLLLNGIGAAIWATALAAAAYHFGAVLEGMLGSIKKYELWVLGALLVLGVGLWLRRRFKNARLARQKYAVEKSRQSANEQARYRRTYDANRVNRLRQQYSPMPLSRLKLSPARPQAQHSAGRPQPDQAAQAIPAAHSRLAATTPAATPTGDSPGQRPTRTDPTPQRPSPAPGRSIGRVGFKVHQIAAKRNVGAEPQPHVPAAGGQPTAPRICGTGLSPACSSGTWPPRPPAANRCA